MARDNIPGDVWWMAYKAVGVKEGNPAQLINPEITSSL